MGTRRRLTPNRIVEDWFAHHGWKPFAFQRRVWRAHEDGRSGLVHAPTGYGKTYSVWMAAVREWLAEHPNPDTWNPRKPEPPRVLWLTPLRALANDTTESLRAPIADLGLPWTVELRTGDASQRIKKAVRTNPPTALVTTPESLSLMLSWPETKKAFSNLRMVIVDEWHELLGSKRGVQTELCLAHLRAWNPRLRTWGLSATLGNIEQARDVLLGLKEGPGGLLVTGKHAKKIEVRTVAPSTIERFPWAGHLGLKLLPEVIEAVENANSTLLFTNTRSQAEMWFRALAEAKPEWSKVIALHHGSLDREVRLMHEAALRHGALKCVVCTSSLDLGVDFSPVDQVIQVGSPKGVARLMQRAGRSGHQPGAVSRILGVPAHALELVEFAAVRDAVAAKRLEPREPLELCLDVLVQHLVTIALGEGFAEEPMRAEIQTGWSYRNLRDDQWRWALDFITRGGPALRAYPQFRRVVQKDGRYIVDAKDIARLHRMSIGTIASDASVTIKFANGGRIGSVEESFIARLRPGDRFLFSGRVLELVRFKDLIATVRHAKTNKSGNVPQWMGGRMPLSTQLAKETREKIDEARRGEFHGTEMQLVAPLLEVQKRWSILPAPDELLIERIKTRDGWHHFLFPFAGRLAHEGLGPLLAMRLARVKPASFSLFQNDYGLELLSPTEIGLNEEQWREVLSPENLAEDFVECLNSTQLARHQFRFVARVAGLVFQGYPGSQKSTRQLQASSGLLYDVFAQFDPENLLLDQARREVLEQQLELNRVRRALERAQSQRLRIVEPERLTPLAFPIYADRLREHVSFEKWEDRITRMVSALERAAGKTGQAGEKKNAR